MGLIFRNGVGRPVQHGLAFPGRSGSACAPTAGPQSCAASRIKIPEYDTNPLLLDPAE